MIPVLAAVVAPAGALLVQAGPAAGQAFQVRAGGGAAVPVHAAAELRGPGPTVLVAADWRPDRLVGLRLDAEWGLLDGPTAAPGQEQFYEYGDVRLPGVALNVVARVPRGPARPYVLAGAGAYRVQRLGGPPSPYETTGAVQAGAGIDVRVGARVGGFVEARKQLHLTDHGSQDERSLTAWRVVVGVTVLQF